MIISTPRLRLIEAELSHLGDLEAYHNDPRYLEHYTEPPNTSDLLELFKEWANTRPRLNYQFIMVRIGCSRAIGCAGLRLQGYATGEAELGVEVNPDYWGKGYAKEAVHALLKLGVKKFGVVRFIANTTGTNRAAQGLLESVNFSCTTYQGVNRVYVLENLNV